MAYDPINIDPLDLDKRTGVGVSLPFNNTTGFNSTYTTKDQLRSNILNLFLTKPGERLHQPDFGIDLGIFEQITDDLVDNLKSHIKNAMNTYFPDVVIKTLQILTSEDYNTIFINITYVLPNFAIQDELNVSFPI
jgi:phage baseplate assembly protein W